MAGDMRADDVLCLMFFAMGKKHESTGGRRRGV